ARAEVGPAAPRIDKIRPFFNHPGFIEPFAASTRAALATLPASLRDDAHLVFTAHSIPVAMAQASGPQMRGAGPGGTAWWPNGRAVARTRGRWLIRAGAVLDPSRGWNPTFAITWVSCPSPGRGPWW